MERECVARLACRSPPDNNTLSWWSGGRVAGVGVVVVVGGGGMGGGLKKGKLKWELVEDAAVERRPRRIQIQKSQSG